MVPGFGVSDECPVFWAFIPRVWFPYSSFQQVRQPSILSPVEEDTSKIWDTTWTVFIQGPSIVLLVWSSIMFNGSFLKVCRILRFVKKIRFCLLESGRTKPWCPGLVSGRVPKHLNLLERWIRKPQPRNESSKYGTLGRDTKPGHHGLVRPDSRRENLIFCTIRNFIHALKNEPLNIMLLHTSKTMDGPWIKMVPVVYWGLNNKPSTSCQWLLCFGTNRSILQTLKNEPLNVMLLHTSRRMDGPWIKMVHVGVLGAKKQAL